MPLEMVLDMLTKRDMVIDWGDFLKSSLEHGSNLNSVLNKIEMAVGDCLGPKCREEIMKRIKKL